MSTIYRQYRPQTFSAVSGQNHITNTLKQAILKNKISHAYLFQGPRGTGKTTTARILAKRLNCLKPKKEEPCTTCKNCQATINNRLVDLIEIDAASNRGIDDIRALRDTINLSPSMGKYKIYIIDEVHMLTNEAFAALLKTLEEPVKHAIFILATTELHKVPPTILSRCQVYRFRRAADNEMKSRLEHILKEEKRSADKEALDFIIQRSDGCYRDAESLLGQMLTLHEKNLTRDNLSDFLGLPPPDMVENLVRAMSERDTVKALEISHTAYESGFDPEQLLEEVIRFSRDTAFNAAKNAQGTPGWLKQGADPALLPKIIRACLQALQDLAYVPQPLIAVQLAILSVCGSNSQAPAKNMPFQSDSTQPAQKTSFNAEQRQEPRNVYVKKTTDQDSTTQKNEYTVQEDRELYKIERSKPSIAKTGSPTITIEDIKSRWSKLIESIRSSDPVSSTFLRATHPQKIDNDILTVLTQYPLHQNFFNKPEKKTLIEDKLSDILNLPIKTIFQLDPSSDPGNIFASSDTSENENEDLYKNVKEIFGS